MSESQIKPATKLMDYETGSHPDLPPPAGTTGYVGWIRKNFFNGWLNSILTIICLYLLYLIIPPILSFYVFDAVLFASSRDECRELGSGACWAFIKARLDFFTYGFYPADERWRPNLAFILFLIALGPALFDKFPKRKLGLIYTAIFPFIGMWLILGGFGLEPVETDKIGGILLTLILGVTGIAFSFPIGVILALGRYNDRMPAVQMICVIFIEVIRGVPLIALLFIASTMLNFFMPPGTNFDILLRVIIMVVIFASAYMAEVIRGGLQAIPKGQFEGADALGLNYWQSMRSIVLPQALKVSIPGIVNTFVSLYKDTTLVLIIGLLDILGAGRNALSDLKWSGLALEVYSFAALFFFISCYAMSRYSYYLERKLHTGHKR
ncbi:MAG: amino acid ABC transporter permease [Alphaproteobacteria bacterium]